MNEDESVICRMQCVKKDWRWVEIGGLLNKLIVQKLLKPQIEELKWERKN